MKWNKFRLKTTTEAEDIVSSMLADLGIEGVEIEDKVPLTQSDKAQMFVDILPEIDPDDGVAYLSFYLEEEDDAEKILADVKQELKEMYPVHLLGADVLGSIVGDAVAQGGERGNDQVVQLNGSRVTGNDAGTKAVDDTLDDDVSDRDETLL